MCSRTVEGGEKYWKTLPTSNLLWQSILVQSFAKLKRNLSVNLRSTLVSRASFREEVHDAKEFFAHFLHELRTSNPSTISPYPRIVPLACK